MLLAWCFLCRNKVVVREFRPSFPPTARPPLFPAPSPVFRSDIAYLVAQPLALMTALIRGGLNPNSIIHITFFNQLCLIGIRVRDPNLYSLKIRNPEESRNSWIQHFRIMPTSIQPCFPSARSISQSINQSTTNSLTHLYMGSPSSRLYQRTR